MTLEAAVRRAEANTPRTMKIRNTEELVRRARAHAQRDHVLQGTYGSAKSNGDVEEFQGCLIGCLAAPHQKRALRSYIHRVFNQSWGDPSRWHFITESEDLTALIEKEFGIPDELQRWAESNFEALEYHGAAIEFIPAFARAVVTREGKRISRVAIARARAERRGLGHDGDVLDWLSGGEITLEKDVLSKEALAVRGHRRLREHAH